MGTELAAGMAFEDSGSNMPYPGSPGIFFSDFHLLSGEYNPDQPGGLNAVTPHLGSFALTIIIRLLLIQEMYRQEGILVAAITVGIARLLLQMRRIQ